MVSGLFLVRLKFPGVLGRMAKFLLIIQPSIYGEKIISFRRGSSGVIVTEVEP